MATVANPVGAPAPARRRSKGLSEKRLAQVMVMPSMILIVVVAAWPVIYAIWLSLNQYSVRVAGLSRWVGFDNYTSALSSSDWRSALIHTLHLHRRYR